MNRIRIGCIGFVNSLPVDYGLTSGAVPAPEGTSFVSAEPAVLNRLFGEGRLDIGPVSSLFYAANTAALDVLPDFSVSSRSGVRSVLLFSKVPLEALGRRTIAVTPKGYSTPVLLRILLARRHGVVPVLRDAASPLSDFEKGEADAALVIGDDALRAGEKPPAGAAVYDLGAEWKKWTGTPFVFAVWVVRRVFAESETKAVAAAAASLAASRKWGRENSEVIVDEAVRRTGLPPPVLRAYFRGLSFDFGPDLRRGLTLFRHYAVEEGFLQGAFREDEKRHVGILR